MLTDGGGWTILIDADYATDSCPSVWRSLPNANFCARIETEQVSELELPTWSLDWSEGRVHTVMWRYNNVDAFNGGDELSDVYLDGMAITAGDPAEHMYAWALGAGGGFSRCPAGGGTSAPTMLGVYWQCDYSVAVTGWLGPYFDTTANTPELEGGDVHVRLMAKDLYLGGDGEDVAVQELMIMVR